MTLIDNTGYPVAWPCGATPVSRRQAQASLDEANDDMAAFGSGRPYVKAIVPSIDLDGSWGGTVYAQSALERLAGAADV